MVDDPTIAIFKFERILQCFECMFRVLYVQMMSRLQNEIILREQNNVVNCLHSTTLTF